MPRYINADAFYDELERSKEMMLKQGGWSAPIIASSIDIVQRRIKGYPTADVAPVVHAHRENALSMCGQTYKRCSLCGSRLSAVKARYCAHCGARMDEEEKEDG